VAEYHKKDYLFAVVNVDISYKKPAKLGEIIEVTTEVIETTNATITIHHQVFKEDILLVESQVRLACIDKDGRPRRLPEDFKKLRN
jgi:acyl-CoA thioester hydrolase